MPIKPIINQQDYDGPVKVAGAVNFANVKRPKTSEPVTLLKKSRMQEKYVLNNRQKKDLLGRKTQDPVVMITCPYTKPEKALARRAQSTTSIMNPSQHQGKAKAVMDSNVFGGVTTKLIDMLTLEEQVKFQLVDCQLLNKSKAAPQYHYVESKVKKVISRPVSQFEAYRKTLPEAKPVVFNEYQPQHQQQFQSINKLNLQEQHHLLKSVITRNQETKTTQQSCVGHAQYDIESKQTQFQKVRESHGVRVHMKDDRQEDEAMHNAISHMKLSNVIDQMMANAEEKKPNVPLSKLTKSSNQMYLNRMNHLKGNTIAINEEK